ncbi:MAG: tetratricopeptide repeat protein, partial [Pseudomonadota bacterium]
MAAVAAAVLASVVAGGVRAEVGDASAAPGATTADVFRQWLPDALRGDAAAQFEVGRAFAAGAGRPEDLAEAARWYRLAAEQGSARAQHDLAVLYAKGQGVPQDYVQAYVWFDQAAARFGQGRSYDQAAEMRDMMAAFMTPEQLAEAKRQSLSAQGPNSGGAPSKLSE